MKRARVVVCLLALGANGCSFVFAGGPPANHRELKYFDCPTSHAPPIIDTVVAVTGGAVTFLAWGLGTALASDSGGSANTILLAGIPLVLLPAASAIYGYSKGGDCRDAKAELVARIYAPPVSAPPVGAPSSDPSRLPIVTDPIPYDGPDGGTGETDSGAAAGQLQGQ
jgi:hypothetical protein